MGEGVCLPLLGSRGRVLQAGQDSVAPVLSFRQTFVISLYVWPLFAWQVIDIGDGISNLHWEAEAKAAYFSEV